MVLKYGQMVPGMKGNTLKEKSMVVVNFIGPIILHMLVSFKKIIFTAKVYTYGVMRESLVVTGK